MNAEPESLLERIATTFQASRAQRPDDARLNATLTAVSEQAPLFFRGPLPNWPPRLLLLKIVRRLLWTFLRRQYLFNMAVRDTLAELRRDRQRDAAQQDEVHRRLQDLEGEVARLSARVEALTGAPAEAPRR